MLRSRRLMTSAIVLIGMLFGCGTTEEVSGPSNASGGPSAPLLGGDGSLLDNSLESVLHILSCTKEEPVTAQATIGPEGGSLTIGRHRLDVPVGALTQRVTITGTSVGDATASVKFEPEGLTFAKPATLTLSYRHCVTLPLLKTVVFTTDDLSRILEQRLSKDYPLRKYVEGSIDHFSRYAIAW